MRSSLRPILKEKICPLGLDPKRAGLPEFRFNQSFLLSQSSQLSELCTNGDSNPGLYSRLLVHSFVIIPPF